MLPVMFTCWMSLDVAGERLGREGRLLLPVVHGDNLLEGALQVQSGFQGHVLHLAERGYDAGVAGLYRRRAHRGDHQQCEHDNARDNQSFFLHGLSLLFRFAVSGVPPRITRLLYLLRPAG